MSMAEPALERPADDTPPARNPHLVVPVKPQRVLACLLCQQRKVKCDRKFPCSNCIRSGAQCVSASSVRRPRKRRFPERALLDRIRTYEDLLHKNNVKFEPLHNDGAGASRPADGAAGDESDDGQHGGAVSDWSSPSGTVKSDRIIVPKNLLHAMNQGFRDFDNESDSSPDEVWEGGVMMAWDRSVNNSLDLLLGMRKSSADLSTVHPEPAHIFRLWQVYLETVDPLLKVTHNPSLQGRIVEASSNVTNIGPSLEALMFSIYCMSIQSLTAEYCQATFNSSKEDMLARYQYGCQQALLNAGFLHTDDRLCLTALYLYLVSLFPSRDLFPTAHPRALAALLGVAFRIAERIGIHSEAVSAKCSVFEAEMRRRLWWSMVLFDSRMSELADYNTTTLSPIWDCKVPLNVNDSDLHPEMKEPPSVQGRLSESVFAVTRSEIGDFIRHTTFHLDFVNPALKSVARESHNGTIPEHEELATLEKLIEDKYLRFCAPDNPIHFFTLWMARGYLARCRLIEHYGRVSGTPALQDGEPTAIIHAVRMLEYDTKIMVSPLTKGYLWFANFHFPFLAYIHILQELKRRPDFEQAERAWEVMSDNYGARVFLRTTDEKLLFGFFSKMVMGAWTAYEAVAARSGRLVATPRMVADVQRKLAELAKDPAKPDAEQPGDGLDTAGMLDVPMPMEMGFGGSDLLYGMDGQDGFGVTRSELFPGIPGQAPMTMGGMNHMNHLNWAAMTWGMGARRPW